MKSYRGRPLIEGSDSPLTVDRALHASVGYWNQHMPPDQADAWPKQAADAWGAVEDGFGINGTKFFDQTETRYYL